MSVRSIQHLVQKALINLGLQSKHYTVHTLRHPAQGGTTHLVESGTDLHTVKELLGHSSLQTTLQYLHLTNTRLQTVVSPYDVLMEEQCSDKAKASRKTTPKK